MESNWLADLLLLHPIELAAQSQGFRCGEQGVSYVYILFTTQVECDC
jgi:hypothetical protein